MKCALAAAAVLAAVLAVRVWLGRLEDEYLLEQKRRQQEG